MKHWEDLALETAERFGGNLPHPTTAQAIAHVYAKAPQAVERAIDRVAQEYEAGGIRSPWGILKTRVEQITTEQRSTSRANERDREVERAEQWIRNAGCHMTWDECEDELFAQPLQTPPLEYLERLEEQTRDNPGRPIFNALLQAAITRTRDEGVQDVPDTAGRLADHATPELHARMQALWNEHRPAALATEVDAIQRGLTHQAQRERLGRKPNQDPDKVAL